MNKYRIHFSNVNEIRMGSTYNVCDLKVEGDYVPELPEKSFQDLASMSEDGSICYLVEWSLINNDPGFKVWRLDGSSRSLSISTRFENLCSEISAVGDNEVRIVLEKLDEPSDTFLSAQMSYTFE